MKVYFDGARPTDSDKQQTLWGIPWSEFADVGKKSPVLPLREEFGRHLLQVHSVSGSKADELLSAFPTPYRWVQYAFYLNVHASYIRYGIHPKPAKSILRLSMSSQGVLVTTRGP